MSPNRLKIPSFYPRWGIAPLTITLSFVLCGAGELYLRRGITPANPNLLESTLRRNNTRSLQNEEVNLLYGPNNRCGQWKKIGSSIRGSAEFEYSGSSLATSADGLTIAVGAPYNSNKETHVGAVRVFRLSNEWTQLGGDLIGRYEKDFFGSSIAMSSRGNIVAIGSVGFDGDKRETGRVKVMKYNFSSDSWDKMGNIIVGNSKYEWLGYSLSMSGNGRTIAVASAGYNSKTATTIYSYDNSSSKWNQIGDSLTEEDMGDYKGGVSLSLSTDGSIVAIGCGRDSTMGKSSGRVRVFQYNTESLLWEIVGQDLFGNQAGENFGSAVSLTENGDTLVVGADGFNNNQGCTRVFHYRSEKLSWKQLGGDIEGDREGSLSGTSVSVSSDGDLVAIGAIGIDKMGNDSGHTNLYTFGRGRKVWIKVGNSIVGSTRDDYAGGQVAVSGDGKVVVVASPMNSNDSGGKLSGLTRAFQFSAFDSCAPTMSPTVEPTKLPSREPTPSPTKEPTTSPSSKPTMWPTSSPTVVPTSEPTSSPTSTPTSKPTSAPTAVPTSSPTSSPTNKPTSSPSSSPTNKPTSAPTAVPTSSPTSSPTDEPSATPTAVPSSKPTMGPTSSPSLAPTTIPTSSPTSQPSSQPTDLPTRAPSSKPSIEPTVQPTTSPSGAPHASPSLLPSLSPSTSPTAIPTVPPSASPTKSMIPSTPPSDIPSETATPSDTPSENPSNTPTSSPTSQPSSQPTDLPTRTPSTQPSIEPTVQPTTSPSRAPHASPSLLPSLSPSISPTTIPTVLPSTSPTRSMIPSDIPSDIPSENPSNIPTDLPSVSPTVFPSISPTLSPSDPPTEVPTTQPTGRPSAIPSDAPSAGPTESVQPTSTPTTTPTSSPSNSPSQAYKKYTSYFDFMNNLLN